MIKTWKPFFIWNGVGSFDMRLEVLKLPSIVRPEQRVDVVAIPGRHGALHVTDGTFEPVVRPVEIAMIGGVTDGVYDWLRGSGEVIFSNEREKVYTASIFNKISLEQMIRQIKKGQILFNCQPFKYEISQQVKTIIKPCALFNPGTVESNPIIKIHGKGDMAVSINGRSFLLLGITDYIVIDSRMQCAYRADNELMNNHMTGVFPYFDVGDNIIKWTGGVSEIEILPYWGWL